MIDIGRLKRISRGDFVFEAFCFIFITVLGIVCLYPVMYVFSASISNPAAVMKGQVKFFPVGFSLDAYKKVLEAPMVWLFYYNTVWYTVIGTTFNIVATVLLAYPLSKKQFVLRGPINLLVIIPMFFSGGLVPTFLLVNSLGLYGSRWIMVTIGLVNTFNMIIARTFFQTLPEELFENARLEGASEFRILGQIVVPLSKPILAVLALYYGVSHWNAYFTALIYLPKYEMQPIQALLRRVVLQNSRDIIQSALNAVDMTSVATAPISNQVKYAVIFFAMIPIMCFYPFLQKYFVKGVMIGALKG